MTTATKKMIGKRAWEWMQDRCPKWGSLLVPDARFPYGPQPTALPLTVGEMEDACGVGALAAAKKYCKQSTRREFGPHFPYAARIVDGRLKTVADGEEQGSDTVHMHYPAIA